MTEDQEKWWEGNGGTGYTKRQTLTVESRAAMFRTALSEVAISEIKSVIEFGAGTGDNLRALLQIGVIAQLTGVEINEEAYADLCGIAGTAIKGSILDSYQLAGPFDLVITRGLLIHIAPENLPRAYTVLHQAARKYLLICEYFSPSPRMIPYRGQDNMLWARDFAGEMMDSYPDLRLIDYGWVYHRDPIAPQDDVSWFLMEKS